MSAKPFLITGLPRSRTAWMAAFMSSGSVLCKHEPLKFLSDIRQLPSALGSEFHTHVGASDSGAGFFLPWIMSNMNPPTVIIDRNTDDAKRSMLVDLGIDVGDSLHGLKNTLTQFRAHPNVMWVPFDSLNDKRVMQKIWFHLLPGVPFDEERYEQFNDLDIQVIFKNVQAQVNANANGQANLYREVSL